MSIKATLAQGFEKASHYAKKAFELLFEHLFGIWKYGLLLFIALVAVAKALAALPFTSISPVVGKILGISLGAAATGPIFLVIMGTITFIAIGSTIAYKFVYKDTKEYYTKFGKDLNEDEAYARLNEIVQDVSTQDGLYKGLKDIVDSEARAGRDACQSEIELVDVGNGAGCVPPARTETSREKSYSQSDFRLFSYDSSSSSLGIVNPEQGESYDDDDQQQARQFGARS